MQFYGRHDELAELNRLYKRPGATFAVIYGRRRVGKTALLTHWLGQRPAGRSLLWFATDGTPEQQLAAFSQAVMEFLGRPESGSFRFRDWKAALGALTEATAEKGKLVVAIDEFTYLLSSSSKVSSEFQAAWDLTLRDLNIMLVICGSYMGMMHEHVLSSQAPLYGRAQATLFLQPFSYGHTRAFFQNYPADRRVALYAIWGGVAGYWDRLDSKDSLRKNIVTQLLTPNSAYHSEPRLLIYDHVQEPGRYTAILRAISHGARTLTEIATAAGLPATQLGPYLRLMEEARMVERRTPVTAGATSKSGRYYVIDPYLRFYYRFIEPHIAEIEMGQPEQALETIEGHMADFIGTHTWEELCREWIRRAGPRGELGFSPGRVGAYWSRESQIDVAAVNPQAGMFLLGECKWTRGPEGVDSIYKMIEQADGVLPKRDKGKKWALHLLGFARGGYDARAAKEAIGLVGRQGDRWKLANVRLLSLAELDGHLVEWAEQTSASKDEIDY